MTRAFFCPALVLVCFSASAQRADAPRFEAADVHASAPGTTFRDNFMRGPFVGGGRFEIRKATMLDLIRLGWSIQSDKIVGGPAWIGSDRFDILARAPANASSADLRLMLQRLLGDRFSLKVHNDTKLMPAFALVVAPGKRPRLKEADDSGETGCKGENSASGQGTGRLMMSGPDGVITTLSLLPGGLVQYNCRNITMAAFAASLERMPGANVGPNPIADETGLKGAWNFEIKYSFNLNGPFPMMNGAAAERIPFGDALEKQLGLRLDKREVPMPVVAVDSVDEKPVPNPAGMTLNLPALPTEFEVADIKQTPSDFRFGMFRPQRGGRVDIQGLSLKGLIQEAWNIYGQDMIIGLPKSADTDRYNIVAKAPTYGPESDAATGAGPEALPGPRFQTIDQDSINTMLRNLLIERFKIKYHTEERPTTAFVLTAARPKMKKADPAGRMGCHEGAGPDGKDPRLANPAAGRLMSCQNMTMKEFAQNLPMIAGGYIQGGTVYDETGVAGAFDFTLNFSGAGMVGGPGRGGRGGEGMAAGAPDAAEPSGAITLFEAIEKQLGLKLEKAKRPAQVLVIDHIEPKPTEN
jgi:uncharacterized protein (TIGR03435 family)